MRRAVSIALALALVASPLAALAQDTRRMAKPKPESSVTEATEAPAEDPCPDPPEKFDPIPVEIGETVPKCGVLVSEDDAATSAKNNNALKALTITLEVKERYWDLKEKTLTDTLKETQGDRDKWQGAYIEERNGWWRRNGNSVTLVVGVVLGIGLAAATGAVWAEIDKGSK